ncbi:hypothetical protein PTKIN_Ptkin01aG0294900 [Pterospermum kingtungense]
MVVSMVHEASTSMSRCAYHVFLSFRGTDTCKNFTDHLSRALVQVGLHTFRDDEEIERGNNIKEEIEKAILHESKISIIAFSKNYASSTWCLDELVKILEHRKSFQRIVLPVFYDVDPAQIKKQTGSYEEAFARHEENFKSEMDKVQRWRVALKKLRIWEAWFYMIGTYIPWVATVAAPPPADLQVAPQVRSNPIRVGLHSVAFRPPVEAGETPLPRFLGVESPFPALDWPFNAVRFRWPMNLMVVSLRPAVNSNDVKNGGSERVLVKTLKTTTFGNDSGESRWQ